MKTTQQSRPAASNLPHGIVVDKSVEVWDEDDQVTTYTLCADVSIGRLEETHRRSHCDFQV